MTPAVNLLKKGKYTFTLHTYQHDENHPSFGLEASEKLNVPPERVFKTLVVEVSSQQLVVAVLPVNKQLSMKRVANAVSAKKAEMADKVKVQRATGYVLGGVSPLGQKKSLKTLVDTSASGFESIFISAGKRGLEIELAATDLLKATRGAFCDLSA
jgi:Cys-tRNA(Pro)/Cys-tRNA(Cys) deacylase